MPLACKVRLNTLSLFFKYNRDLKFGSQEESFDEANDAKKGYM
jgi:hypothetical protein